MTQLAQTPDQTQTPEQIAAHYSAALDSVNLINGPKPDNMSDTDWAGAVARNKEHLVGMIAKTYWTTEDLTPLVNASK